MERSHWEEAWREGRLGFHQDEVNPQLVENATFLCEAPTRRVLVPLCGKTRDMEWLRSRFDEVVGVEIIEDAVRAWFEEHEVPYTREHHDVGVVYTGDGVRLYSADFFDMTRGLVGPVDAVFDRAALVALPPDMRRRYAAHTATLLDPGARVLLVTLEYDQALSHGPPFGVLPDEVRALYGPHFELEYVQGPPADGLPPRFGEVPVRTGVWRMRRKDTVG